MSSTSEKLKKPMKCIWIVTNYGRVYEDSEPTWLLNHVKWWNQEKCRVRSLRESATFCGESKSVVELFLQKSSNYCMRHGVKVMTVLTCQEYKRVRMCASCVVLKVHVIIKIAAGCEIQLASWRRPKYQAWKRGRTLRPGGRAGERVRGKCKRRRDIKSNCDGGRKARIGRRWHLKNLWNGYLP